MIKNIITVFYTEFRRVFLLRYNIHDHKYYNDQKLPKFEHFWVSTLVYVEEIEILFFFLLKEPHLDSIYFSLEMEKYVEIGVFFRAKMSSQKSKIKKTSL